MITLTKELQLIIIREAIRLLKEKIADKEGAYSLCNILDEVFFTIRFSRTYSEWKEEMNSFAEYLLDNSIVPWGAEINKAGRHSIELFNYENANKFIKDANLPVYLFSNKLGYWFWADDYKSRILFLEYIQSKLREQL